MSAGSESASAWFTTRTAQFFLTYWEERLPISPRSYRMILGQGLAELEAALGPEKAGIGDVHLQELLSILTALENLPPRATTAPAKILERHREKEVMKRRLAALVEQSEAIRAHVSRAVGGVVRSRSICSACSGGAIALVQAAAWLMRGEVDHVLAGGADGLCRLTLLGFNALGATDPALCRPFDRSRGGLNLGEGAAVLVLEREETARARGAQVLAFLDGFAVGAEAHHITHPDPEATRARALMREAMKRAGFAASDIGYVNAHGTGTQQNDAMEARALVDVLGASAAQTWVSSSKAQLGHTLGASGALEAAITVLSLANQQVPPTAGLVEPEESALRHVLATGQPANMDAALSSSFGFGGMSCVLAFSGSERPAAVTAPNRNTVSSSASAYSGSSAAVSFASRPSIPSGTVKASHGQPRRPAI